MGEALIRNLIITWANYASHDLSKKYTLVVRASISTSLTIDMWRFLRQMMWPGPYLKTPTKFDPESTHKDMVVYQVMEKFKSLNLECEEVILRPLDKQFATDLISNEFFEKYIMDVPPEKLSEEVEDPKSGLSQASLELNKGRDTLHHHVLPLNVKFTPCYTSHGQHVESQFLQLLKLLIGPLDATLQVGDRIYEWNDSSLIIPMPL